MPTTLNLKRKPREIDRKGRGAVVASVKRNRGRRKELQKAEYRNRKDGMATGRTEEKKAPWEPPPGENGKKGKERAEG